MFVIAGKSYVDNCYIYACLICHGNTLKHRCFGGGGRYNIEYDARYKVCNGVAVWQRIRGIQKSIQSKRDTEECWCLVRIHAMGRGKMCIIIPRE